MNLLNSGNLGNSDIVLGTTTSTPSSELNSRPDSNTHHNRNNFFSIFRNRQSNPNSMGQIHQLPTIQSLQQHVLGLNLNYYNWPRGGSTSRTSYWTKYCLLCTLCGSAATLLAGIFLVVAVLTRYYTTSVHYFETVPTYVPAILLSIIGVSTIGFSCKRNRNIILLRLTACWSLLSAAISSVITITTSLVHMNRLQTLRECVYSPAPPSCTCFGHSYNIGDGRGSLAILSEPVHYVFENTADCDVVHGALYSCLRAVFAISVVAVLLSIFLCMLLYQLIGHERKKAYWSRIRRMDSDFSTDFLNCLARPIPRNGSSILPLMLSNSASGSFSTGPSAIFQQQHPITFNYQLGPPPPYNSLPNANISEPESFLTTNPVPNYTSRPTSFSTGRFNTAVRSNTTPNFIALSPMGPNNTAQPFSPTILSLNSTNTTGSINIPGPSSSTMSAFSINSVGRAVVPGNNAVFTNNIPSQSNIPPTHLLLNKLRESKISIQSSESESENNYCSNSHTEDCMIVSSNDNQPQKIVNVEIVNCKSTTEHVPSSKSLPSSPFVERIKRFVSSPLMGGHRNRTSLPATPIKLSNNSVTELC